MVFANGSELLLCLFGCTVVKAFSSVIVYDYNSNIKTSVQDNVYVHNSC